MTRPLLTKLKIALKRILGKCVYNWIYSKKQIQKIWNTPKSDLLSKKTGKNLITFAFNRWKTCSFIIFCLLNIYYGIGAFVCSKIDNRLNLEIKTDIPQTNVLSALEFTLRAQIDNTPWTPALPALFPASVLDNLPNFQIGAKNTVSYFIRYYAKSYQSDRLHKARELLNYPEDIWLFSQTKQDTFAPGSAKQYHKALAEIENFINKDFLSQQAKMPPLSELLKIIDKRLSTQISEINAYTREHSSEFLDLKTDDLFYKIQGSTYVIHYLLSGAVKDYQSEIVATEQYENITTALKFLSDAVKLNPFKVKSTALNDSYGANHLIYLGYYLLQAESYLKDMRYALEQNRKEIPHED